MIRVFLILFALSALTLSSACAGESGGRAKAQSQFTMMSPHERHRHAIAKGISAVAELRADLQQTDPEAKRDAARLLGELRATIAFDDLLNLLRTAPDLPTKLTAFHALGKLKDPRAVPVLMETASRPDAPADDRRAAVIALGSTGDPNVAPFLESQLNTSDDVLRMDTAACLAMVGSAAGLEDAMSGLLSTNDRVRLHAIEAVGIIGDPRAEARLQTMLRSNPKTVERHAITLARFQIRLRPLTPGARASEIREQIMSGPRGVIPLHWAGAALTDQGEPGMSVLSELGAKHPDARVRQDMQMRLDVARVAAELQKGGTNEK